MSISLCLKSEYLKSRKSIIYKIPFILIIISCLLLALDLIIRKEAVLTYGNFQNPFYSLILENHSRVNYHLFLLFTIISSSMSISFIDYSDSMLNVILTCPIKRSSIYISKLFIVFATTIISIVTNGLFIYILSKSSGISSYIDIGFLVRYMWMQFFASLAIISLSVMISMIFKNEMISIGLHLALIIISVFMKPEYIPYNPYMYLMQTTPFYDANILVQTMINSIILSIIFFIVGFIIFNNKDIRG